jgi:predicted membrane metal-binding protein
MLILSAIFRWHRIYTDPFSVLCISAGWNLLWVPELLFQPGFILSSLCTAFLLSLHSSSLLRVGFWIPIFALPITVGLNGYFCPLTGLLQLVLNAAWEGILMPIGFSLPFLKVVPEFITRRVLFSLEWLLNFFVQMHPVEQAKSWVLPAWSLGTLEQVVIEGAIVLYLYRYWARREAIMRSVK